MWVLTSPISVLALVGVSALVDNIKRRKRSARRKLELRLQEDSAQIVFAEEVSDPKTLVVKHEHPSATGLVQEAPLLTFRHAGEPPTLSDTAWELVTTRKELRRVARALEGAPWVAVDLEHNAARSYFGVTCLLQLSTGDLDCLVDTLALRDDMALLQPLFGDPKTVKILHGAGNDVIWLQRDFQLYLAPCFDTQQAAQVLGLRQCSLGHLLASLLSVTVDKSFQLADWRIRPIPEDALVYARSDVHWLGHLAAVMVQQLEASPEEPGKPPLLQRVWQKSQAVTAALYRKPTPYEAAVSAGTVLFRKHRQQDEHNAPAGEAPRAAGRQRTRLDTRALQRSLLALCMWRDTLARSLDEGIQYVAPDRVLLALLDAQPTVADHVRQLADHLTGTVGQAALTNLLQHADQICTVLHDAVTGDDDPRLVLPHPSRELDSFVHSNISTETSRAQALRDKRVKKFSSRSAVYENCRILAENGAPLCFCDKRKLDWYVERGLAERITEADSPTVRLLFEHKNADQMNDKDLFYSASKKNQCVVCGTEDHYLRYRIIPAAYRRHLPLHFKSHRSHDIVLLCVDCHEQAQLTSEDVKRELAAEYAVPLLPPWHAIGSKATAFSPTGNAVAHFPARSAATALLRHGSTMPPERRLQLESVVRQCIRADESEPLRCEDLMEALVSGLPPKQRAKALRRRGEEADAVAAPSEALGSGLTHETAHMWHGRKLVEAAKEAGGEAALFEICRRFRHAFKENLRPRHLPAGWNVDHDAKREFGTFSVYLKMEEGGAELS